MPYDWEQLKGWCYMRHLLFITVLSVVITPIVALQEGLTNQNGSQPSMQSQIRHSVDQISREAANLLDSAENRIMMTVKEWRR